MRNISQNKQFEIYDSIIREQLDSGIVKKINKNCVCQGKEYYMKETHLGFTWLKVWSLRKLKF